MKLRRGFTLMEVLVGLFVAVAVVATARGLIDAVGDAGERVAASAADQDVIAGGELLARAIVRQARVLAGDSVSLLGTARGFIIESWCPVPGGWSEPCSAAFVLDDSTRSLMLRSGKAHDLTRVIQARQLISIRYLASVVGGGQWLAGWSASDLPLAIGVIVDGDTLLLPAGR